MTIYINGKFLTQRLTGVQRYAYEITKALVAKGAEVKILVPRNFDHAGIDFPEALLVRIGGFTNIFLWEQISIPLFLREKDEYILLSLCNMGPLLVSKQLVCIHDMAFAVNPSWFNWKFSRYYNFIIPILVKRVKKVITVSKFSKEEISTYLGVEPHSISVIYNAPASGFRCSSENEIIVNKGDYFLFVGSFDPRKNLKQVLEVFSLPEFSREKLIVIGGKSRSFNSVNVSLPLNVEIKVNCNDEELSSLYRNAKALINSSSYEGFGLPIVEAMASGCPLILSDIEVFKEVAGEGALYFEASSITELKTVLNLFLKTDSVTKHRIMFSNYERSLQYTWEKSATSLLDAIKNSY